MAHKEILKSQDKVSRAEQAVRYMRNGMKALENCLACQWFQEPLVLKKSVLGKAEVSPTAPEFTSATSTATILSRLGSLVRKKPQEFDGKVS